MNMNRPDKWKEMVSDSKQAKEDFNEFADDEAILWANKELENYKRAMLILANSNNNWPMAVSDDDEALISTMIRRAESNS